MKQVRIYVRSANGELKESAYTVNQPAISESQAIEFIESTNFPEWYSFKEVAE